MKKNRKHVLFQAGMLVLFILAVCAGRQLILSQQQAEPDNPIQGISKERSHNLNLNYNAIELDYDTYQNIMAATALISDREKPDDQEETSDQEKAENRDNIDNLDDADGRMQETGGADNSDGQTEEADGQGAAGDGAGVPGTSQETDLAFFNTSIRDGETVSEPEYGFSIYHLNQELTVQGVYVYVNGRLNLQFAGSVLLSDGRNSIRVSVTYKKPEGSNIRVYKVYRVYYDRDADSPPEESEDIAPEDITLITSALDGETVSERTYDFTAEAEDSSGKSYRVTAVINGNTVTDRSGSSYHGYLDKKKNTLRFRVSLEGGKKAEWLYTIYYIPATTPETQPVVHMNLTDGMVSQSSGYTLDIEAADYQGNCIFYNNLTVTLNGTKLYHSWATGMVTSYWLELAAGENVVTVRAEDEAGRYVEEVYHVTYSPPDANVPIGYIQIRVEAGTLGLGTLIHQEDVPIYADVPFSYYFVSLLEENGFGYTNGGTVEEGFYLKTLDKPGIAAARSIPEELRAQIDIDGLMWTGNEDPDSIGEYDYTQGSGWMYSVNGNYYNYSMTNYHPTDGDVVRIRYTLANGKDIGGFASTGTPGGSINSNYAGEW